MYSRRASPIEQNPNTVAPRPTDIRHEGQTPFVSATTHVQLEEETARDIAARISPGIPDRNETSPSPHRVGQQLVLSDPPSRTVSQTGETMRINSPLDSHGDNRAANRGNPTSISTESSITPTIRFSALDGIISTEQSIGLRRLIAHHALQRQKLTSAGSYMSSLRNEAVELRSTAESLTRRLDRISADTVQLLLEGDNIIAAIGKAFDGPSNQEGPSISSLPVEGRLPYGQSYDDIFPVEQQMEHQSNHQKEDSGSTGRQPNDHNNIVRGSSSPSEGANIRNGANQAIDPSSQLKEMMEREFAPRRTDETDTQYENRYLAQQRRINNTQQSWARSEYDVPPHLESASTANRGTGNNVDAPAQTINKKIAPIPGRLHPDAPGMQQYRDASYASLYRTPRDQRVQFGVLPDQRQNDSDQYQAQNMDGHNGISAYRVSQGPPNNGLWNTEQYHYTVMLKRIKKLVHWKVGISISAPPGAKQPKMGEPAKYAGNRNHDVFLQWLNQFLNWLRSHYYCGEDADFSRLNFLGNYVDGVAADWYAADVDNPDKMTIEPMKFVDAICAMHRRFVRTATANNAVTQYDRVEYSSAEGVEGFYYKLDKMASRMIERPSDYSFRLRLYEGLPSWIYDTLLERNILPEFCTLEDIRENARQIEELSMRARGTYKGSAVPSSLKRATDGILRNSNTSSNSRGPPPRNNRTFNSTIPRHSDEHQSGQRPNNVRFSNRPNGTNTRVNNSSYRNQTRTSSAPGNSKPGAARAEQRLNGPKDNKLVECYRCHQMGHIATDPKCPQHPTKMGRTRFNAQRLIEDETEGEEEAQQEYVEDPEDLQDGNSWGGSQYEPEEDFDEGEDNMVHDEPSDNFVEDEDEQDEVRMSSMRTLRLHMMRRVPPRGEILDMTINSRIAGTNNGGSNIIGSSTQDNLSSGNEEPPIPDIEGTPDDSRGDRNDSIHAHLFDDDAPIEDPVFIEYRDGLVFRVQPIEDWDVFRELLESRAQCPICHTCKPMVRQHIFTGQQSGEAFYYLLWTCRTPIERRKAEEDIDPEESEFDVSRFFANRIITGASDSSSDPAIVNDRGGEGSENNEEIPDLVDTEHDGDEEPTGGNTSERALSPSILTYMDERAINEQDFIRDNIHCPECGDCRPRIIADHTRRSSQSSTYNLRAICMNSGTIMEICPEHQEIIMEGTRHIRVPTIIQNNEDQYDPQLETISNSIEDTAGMEDEERQEPMARYHHSPPECPHCHDCRPIIEEVYYMGSDGEVFYRDRLVCQANADPDEVSNGHINDARLQAMRMVYSSNVRRKNPHQQPIRTSRLQATLSAEVEINGVKALTLFDTGSTTDSITPEFAFATKAKTFKLDEQVILQLGCVGSRSKISYGTRVPIGFGNISNEVYYDLVNIDRYDCIIGTPFMNTHKVCLDFGTRTITINGQEIPALSFEEEQHHVDQHKKIRSQKQARPPPRETAPLKRRIVSGPLPSTST